MTDPLSSNPVGASGGADAGVKAEGIDSIPDRELLRRVLHSFYVAPKTSRARRVPMWTKAMRHFGLGSTYAWQLCKRHGFDPDQEVRP